MASQGPDFASMSQEWYQQWERGMASWWDQVLESPAFLEAMGKNLSNQSQARGAYTRAVDESLEKMHLPTRSDLVRVARIATLLEEKILQVEDQLLVANDRLASMEREVIQARIEAAEARLEAREQLARLHERLAALAPADATTAEARKRPARGKDGSDAA